MIRSRWLVLVGGVGVGGLIAGHGGAVAGGLFLPGNGAVSTSRAGASVAAVDDGEAIAVNPAGIAKASGTTITVSAAMLSYAMEFQRRGTYDPAPGESYPYAGQPFALVKNDVRPPLGIGSLQPVPVIAVTTDLGGLVPGLRLAAGIYPPNAYPFRDMCTQLGGRCDKYVFNADFAVPPPSTRYDIMYQEAAVFLPSLVAAYRILPTLDVGVRLSAAHANLKSTTALWGLPGNYSENPKVDSVFTVDATDSFVPAFGLGATFRPTPALELGVSYSSELAIHARGTAVAENGPSVALLGIAPQIVPVPDDQARCARGGTQMSLASCVDLALPMTAQLGARYRFLDGTGGERGDVELDLDWENWGKTCDDRAFNDGSCASPSDYRVIVDAQAEIAGNSALALPLKTAVVRHGLRDTIGVRLGGSYRLPVGAPRDEPGGDHGRDQVIFRGGLAYDTGAARTGWLRADLDGAARTTLALGAAYRTRRFEVTLGAGAVLEGSPSNPNVGGGAAPCNPTTVGQGCSGTGDAPVGARQGPDPINPVADPDAQLENPIAQGDYKAHYFLLMLGGTARF